MVTGAILLAAAVAWHHFARPWVRAKLIGSIRGVRGCARCGHDHKRLAYLPFEQPIVDVLPDGRTIVWAWWARCPRTGDPVLLADVPKPC